MNDLISRSHFDSRVRAAGGMTEEELTEDFKDGVLTVLEMLKTEPTAPLWNDAKKPPEDERYILLSYSNFSLPDVGQFRDGEYYPGDEDRSCKDFGFVVNGWMELPKNAEEL